MSNHANDNPMPLSVYIEMRRYAPSDYELYDLHHALVNRKDVQGMPLEERKKIHNPINLWWVLKSQHASHANIEDKRAYYAVLCHRWGKAEVDSFINSFNWKSTPPVTVRWLESNE